MQVFFCSYYYFIVFFIVVSYKFTLMFLDFKFLKDSHDEDSNYNNLLLQIPTVFQHGTLLTQHSTTVSHHPFLI